MISEFAKEKVFWTRKMNVKLVRFIENHPNIWNPKHPKYTSIEFKDRTYADFARKYGDEFSGQAVKDRWTNIRSTFANYLRKLKASRLKGDSEFKVNWHLWEPCQFLIKVHRKIKTHSAENGDEEINENEENKDDSCSAAEEMWSEEEDQNHYLDENNLGCKHIADNLLQVFKSVQNDAFGLDNSEHGKIGKIVCKRLSKMNSLDAAMVSKKIMDVLFLYDENNPRNPNNFDGSKDC